MEKGGGDEREGDLSEECLHGCPEGIRPAASKLILFLGISCTNR